jgi:integrase
MVHRFTRCSGLLNFTDFAAFRHHVANLSTDTVREMCALFADRLCASTKSAHAYVRVFNMLFVDVFPVVAQRFTIPRRTHRIIRIDELDDMLSTASSGTGMVQRTDHFTQAETEQLLVAAAEGGARDHLMVALLCTTGLRRRGLLNIRVEDVAKSTNGVWRADAAGTTREKGGKLRSFPVFPLVQVLVDQWLNGCELKGGRPSGPSPYLFPSGTGDAGQLSTSALGKAFRRVCCRAGLGDHRAHLHALRHSCAHRLLDSGNTPRQIAAYLGHSSASTTEKYYLRETPMDVTKHMHLPVEWTPECLPGAVGCHQPLPLPVRDTLRELLAVRRMRM